MRFPLLKEAALIVAVTVASGIAASTVTSPQATARVPVAAPGRTGAGCGRLLLNDPGRGGTGLPPGRGRRCAVLWLWGES